MASGCGVVTRLATASLSMIVACGARTALDVPDAAAPSGPCGAPATAPCAFTSPTTLVQNVSGGTFLVDDTFLYFLAAPPNATNLACALWRANKRTGKVSALAQWNDECGSLAMDTDAIYFTRVQIADGAVVVLRAPKDASAVVTLFQLPGESVSSGEGSVAVDDERVFVSGKGGIWSGPKGAPAAWSLWAATSAPASMLLVDSTFVFARIDSGTAQQIVELSKSSAAPSLVSSSDAGIVLGMTQDDQFVYWNTTQDFLTGRIMRAPKGGGTMATVADGAVRQSQLAVDARYLYRQGPDGNLEAICKFDFSQRHYASGYHMLNDGSPLAVDEGCAYWSELDQPIRVGPK